MIQTPPLSNGGGFHKGTDENPCPAFVRVLCAD